MNRVSGLRNAVQGQSELADFFSHGRDQRMRVLDPLIDGAFSSAQKPYRASGSNAPMQPSFVIGVWPAPRDGGCEPAECSVELYGALSDEGQ